MPGILFDCNLDPFSEYFSVEPRCWSIKNQKKSWAIKQTDKHSQSGEKASFNLKLESLKPTKSWSVKQTYTLSEVIKQILAWIVFALNKSFFQLNPTELLALTCVGEDDRKIIEEVHFFIQMTTTMVLSVLKWMNWRIKRSLVYSIDPHCTGRKQIGRESARKGGGGDTWSDVIRGSFSVVF